VTEVPLSVNLTKAGQIPIRFSLPTDALPQDDTRLLAVNVRQKLDLTVVDGEPSAIPGESETDFITIALTVGNETWKLNRLTDAEFAGNKPASADLMVLANVSQLTTEQVKNLEKQVDAGMGLMIFVGEQVDAQLYKRTPLQRRGRPFACEARQADRSEHRRHRRREAR
jgi:hypothetical protein